jgi:hypothetical protein
MANVIFYSTGEIFWVSDPPYPFGKPHIGVPFILPAVPPDHMFTYAMCAHVLEQNGHKVVGAYGRQRKQVREGSGVDPQILALAEIEDAHKTVLIIIATDSGNRAEFGTDFYKRIPFTDAEKNAIRAFRQRGGGLYVTADHGPLGYKSLEELDLHHPVDPEPDEPLRPNVEWSFDSTDSAKVRVEGQKVITRDGQRVVVDHDDVWLSVGPPAGYLQKIVAAQLLHKEPTTPHPVFNGVGDADGIWIPAHMHETRFKIKASLRGISEEPVAAHKIKALAVHVPFTETTFSSFCVMCYRESQWILESDQRKITSGRVLWDSSFHHLVDINWVADGKVTWDPYVPFSAQALWKQQLPPELFEKRMEKGMKRLFVNIISWLAHELPYHPAARVSKQAGAAYKTMAATDFTDYVAENNYPDAYQLMH